MYSAREQTAILKELQEYSGLDASKFEGTFEYDVFASNSIEFAKIEVELEEMYRQGFAETASGDYLTMRAAEHGITRRLATKSIGVVTVKGNGVLPKGSLFATADGWQVETLEEITIVGSADVAVQSVLTGADGNIEVGAITTISMSIPGMSSVSNAEPFHDGFDDEDDVTLYNRLDFKVKNPITSGNANHYKALATSVAGVGKVTVQPLWAGNGTVRLIILDSNHKPASEDLLNAVRAVITSEQIIGATATVIAPTEIGLAIVVAGAVGKGNVDSIIAELEGYFLSDNFNGVALSPAQVGHIILNSENNEITDYTELTINGGTDKASFSIDEMPKIESVVINNA